MREPEKELIENQNIDITRKYMILDRNDFFDVIKQLEIKIFNLENLLKLSTELNSSYEITIANLRVQIKDIVLNGMD